MFLKLNVQNKFTRPLPRNEEGVPILLLQGFEYVSTPLKKRLNIQYLLSSVLHHRVYNKKRFLGEVTYTKMVSQVHNRVYS